MTTNTVGITRAKAGAHVALPLVAFAIGAASMLYAKAPTITRVQHDTRSLDETLRAEYGKPVNVVDGAQVNAQLAGTRCEVYAKGQAFQALVCR